MFIMEEEKKQYKMQADIRIVGVGGGGNNAVEAMIKQGIQGAQFIVVNTDHQALSISSAQTKIQIGTKLTKGLGAGANPEVGRRAAVESYEEIVKNLKSADMVFITAGMGGGTGTGGAPFVAQAAHELGLLTVGIVTTPFLFEGQKRMKQATQGIQELRNYVDTLIVIPNEKLLTSVKKDTPLLETFKMTDEVLLQAVKGIAELVSVPGLINLDFADIKTVMKDKGMAIMGRGVATRENRAKEAIRLAISSPLLDGVSIKGATGMIVNITADSSLSLSEVQSATSILTQLADSSADIIVGTVIDENMDGRLSVTVIATGFTNQTNVESSAQLESDKNLNSKKNEQTSSTVFTDSALNVVDEEFISEDKIKESNTGSFNTEKEKALSLNQTKDDLQKKNVQEEKITEKKVSPRDMLLSKAREYEENQKIKTENTYLDNQMSMGWEDNTIEEKLSSPFESTVNFSDEDMF